MKNIQHKYYHTSDTFGKAHIDLYKKRISNTSLKWCKQVINILNLNKKIKINDIGCNYFQFYKELKNLGLSKKIDYFGYDIDINFINIGLNKYPELKKKYKLSNIELNNPRKCDISIISGTLEHCKYPVKILKRIINSTKKTIIIRTFIGNKNKKEICRSKLHRPYYINQFNLYFLTKELLKKKRNIKIYKDKATKNSKKYFVNNSKKFIRQMYIIEAF